MAEEAGLLRAPERVLGRPCLLAGSEWVRLEACRDAVRAAARQSGFTQIERVEAGERGFDWNELAQISVSPGLFAERRVLDLRLGGGKLSKEAQGIVLEILERADPDLQVLVSLPEWSRALERESWVKAFGKHGQIVAMWPLKAKDVPAWLATQARARRLSLDDEALELLIWRTDGNLLAATQALDKLALARPDGIWRASELAAHIADDARFDVFRLIEESFGGRAIGLRRVLQVLRAEGEEPARLLAWLTRQLAVMVQLAQRSSNPAAAREFLRGERVFEPLASIMLGARQRHSPQQWECLWVDLLAVDRAAKGRLEEPAWLALERLLLRVALDDSRARAFAA
ncbi:MAG: DNA polymerase III subunit delta [Lysobacterales bacterium]